jgi:hypothetical protein
MIPKISFTSLAAIVSTKASDGVIFCGPAGNLAPVLDIQLSYLFN